MENALTGIAGIRSARTARYCLAVALACSAVPLAALAQDAAAPLDRVADAVRAEPPVRLELNAPVLPSFENPEPGQHPRIDFSLLTTGTTGVGPMLGLNNLNAGSRTGPGLAPTRSTLDLGLHLRHTLQGNRQIDVSAWRRLTPEQDAYTLIQQRQPTYGARVEMKLAPARATSLLFDRSFVGFQLQGGARISVKRSNGKPMIYYRTTF